MKIDLKNQGHPVVPSARGSAPAEQIQDAFKGALRQFLMPPPPAPASLPDLPFNIQHQDLHLNLQSPLFDLEGVFQEIEGFEEATEMRLAETHEDLLELKADVQEDLIQDDIFEESVENREEMEEISEESSEDYEEMLEEFQEEGREIDDKKTDEKELSEPEEPDDLYEELLDQEKDKEEKQKDEGLREELALAKANKGRSARMGVGEVEPESRAMTYQEIQDLIANVLSANKTLPYKVHHLLNQVLQSLLQGQKKLITQQEMVGLEKSHWHLLCELFPARFFGGFIEPIVAKYATDAHTLDQHWQLFQHILYNHPLDSNEQKLLDQLYQISLPEYPLHQALYDPNFVPPGFEDVKNWLEMSQQRSLWLPGASGKLMSLALNYTHHPETGLALFEAASFSAQGQHLSTDHQELLGQVIFERCFSHLTQENHIAPILKKALTGQELNTAETYSLLQGAPQGVLSHLPFGVMPPDLQAMMELVYTDPNYSEEHVLQFLEPSETDPLPAQESRKM